MGNFAENLNLGNRFRPPLFSKIPHTQDKRVNPNEYPVSVVMRFSANLKRKEEEKYPEKKNTIQEHLILSMKHFCVYQWVHW